MSIGDNIRKLRESHGMNQAEFGQIAGVSDKAVSTWENGIKVPRMGAVQKLSDYFGIPKSRILDESSIEEHLEMRKKNDNLAAIVLRMRKDNEFMAAVQALYDMEPEKLSNLLGLLK